MLPQLALVSISAFLLISCASSGDRAARDALARLADPQAANEKADPEPQVDAVPQALKRPCPRPTIVANGATFAEGLQAWQTDRARLKVCRTRHGSLVEAVNARADTR